jgi:uncharacterized protein YjbJ (UPF0337 family)
MGRVRNRTYCPAFLLSVYTRNSGETKMDREHIKGAAEKAKGTIKETAGKLTGEEKLRAEGKFDRARGAAHKAAGDVKEAVRPSHHGSKTGE